MGNPGGEGFESHFPVLAGLRMASGLSPEVRVSPILVKQRVDLIEILEKATVPPIDHLLLSESDSSAERQLQQLRTEIVMLREELRMKGLSNPNLAFPGFPAPSPSNGKLSPPLPWKDVVASDSPLFPRMNLRYCPPSIVNDKLCVTIPEGVDVSGVDKWKDWVVGYFVDRKLPFTVVQSIAKNIWRKFGIAEVLANEDGFFFFRLDKEGAFKQVVESGPWHFGSRLMVLQQWQPQMNLVKKQLTQIPLWAHFYNVPLELWSEAGLSFVASAVGKPLYADQLTESCKRISFAKICVEVDFSSPLLESFDITLPSGAVFTIRVWYPWQPFMCETCKVFGHKNYAAKAVPVGFTQQVWVAKPAPQVDKTSSMIAHVVPSNKPPGPAEIAFPPRDPMIVGVSPEKGRDQLVGHSEAVTLKDKAVSGGPVVVQAVGLSLRSGGTNNGSSSRTKIGENMFSVLQQSLLGDVTADTDVVDDFGLELDALPSEEEFVAGLHQEVLAMASPPKKKGRGRSKGVAKPANKGKGRGVEAKFRLYNIAHTTGFCFPPQWQSVHNFFVDPVARIFLGWDPSVFSCSVLFSSDQLIVVVCTPVDGSIEFVLSIVYGHNNPVDRRLLLNDMRSIADEWCLSPVGDFQEMGLTLDGLETVRRKENVELGKCQVKKGNWLMEMEV
ncbi:hypothetical protein RHSIM_Rhsim11G0120400 [Rhododendron simsii]|uniref:DUF4283 domain-containing protein n=1 Tax=Rhododendron simsii TaxID=118357 RepID=A0A834G9A7_RHOSS|nr:hypothetical protein RHSIM_Rhsim11G0120400 [Rhododendron simsii]